jgi:hypothetical protein
VSYSLSPDVSVLRLQVDEEDEDGTSHLPEGVTSHTQSVYLLLHEGMSSKDFVAGAHMKVSKAQLNSCDSNEAYKPSNCGW